MKHRYGFVSNSSSSSFLVKNWDVFDQKKILSEEDEQKLIEFGFKPVQTHNSMAVACADWKMESLAPDAEEEEPALSYGYNVSCNQSDVIEWLVSHEIPFEALCHYGHHSVIFDGENVYTIPNFGIEAEMHGVEDLDFYFQKGPIRQFIENCIHLLMGRRLRERPPRADIVKVRNKNDYRKTTERILNMSCKGSRPEGDCGDC